MQSSQTACKPGSVPGPGRTGRGGWPFIWDARRRAPRATYPGGGAKPPAGAKPACRPYSVLLPVGFTVPSPLPGTRCALTAPFHPYPRATQRPGRRAGGLLSVALSLGSPPPGVTRHRFSVEPGLSSPRRVAPLPGGGHPAVWHPENGDIRRSSQPSRAISQPSRATVSPSISPSTREGRKWRWKAARTIRVSSSSTPVFGAP